MSKVKSKTTKPMTKPGKVIAAPAKNKKAATVRTIPVSVPESAIKQKSEPASQDSSAKVTLTLKVRDLSWLDRLSINIRENTAINLDRGALLRGIITAIRNSGIDFGFCKTESDIDALVSEKLRL